MKLQHTKIPDVTTHNIEESKLVLSNNIIENIYPLFDEVYQEKRKNISGIQKTYKERRDIVKEKKKELQKLMNEYDREKKVSKLLSRIEKLVESGLIYDGTIKSQTIILLKVIDKLNNEKLDHHLQQTLQIIRKRFQRD